MTLGQNPNTLNECSFVVYKCDIVLQKQTIALNLKETTSIEQYPRPFLPFSLLPS